MQMKSLEILSYSIVMYLSSQYLDTCLSTSQKNCESALINAGEMLGDPRMEGANELWNIIMMLQNIQFLKERLGSFIAFMFLDAYFATEGKSKQGKKDQAR